MSVNNQYDDIIQAEVSRHFPALLTDLGTAAWKLIKAQMWQESEFNPHAVSSCGAQGLMQLMPTLSKDMGVRDPFDPQSNIMGGVIYLAEQYKHFPEIPDPKERIKFAFASYNGGRGYVNKAISIARSDGFEWKKWDNIAKFLADNRCRVQGHRPDHKQITDYVSRIFAKREQL